MASSELPRGKDPERACASADEDRSKAERALGALFLVMVKLRGCGGCPWDRAQTARSLRSYILEEAYETVEAVDGGDAAEIRGELGDLLFQVYFQSEIARQDGQFTLADVASAMAEKLVRRHPHVFAGEAPGDARATEVRWEELKRAEREARGEGATSALAGVPRALPALLRAQKFQERAARVGFDWPSIEGVFEKLSEETFELREAVALAGPALGDVRVESEIGDLLFTVVNLARFLGVSAEDALRGANARFEARFGYVEEELRRQGRSPSVATLGEMDALWTEAKLRAAGAPARAQAPEETGNGP